MSTPVKILAFLAGSILLALSIYFVSLIPAGERRLGRVETVQGIPYPTLNGALHIDEPLAHADLYLAQPAFAKNLELTIEYIPTNITSLAVGVRENSFWLSYPRVLVYEQNERPAPNVVQGIQSSTVTIALTDKLQEPDQSLDLMFFADGDNPQWELVNITATVQHVWPTSAEFKDYARAILYRERAL